jgi:DNA-binding IclR family transcriptional regulator
MAYQRALAAGKVNTQQEEAAAQLLRNVQRSLQPITVVNPYAEHLQLPTEVLKPRRTNTHYLQFIAAVTFYCQSQRPHLHDEQTGEVYIETTLEDIKQANQLLKEILLRKSDELSGACRNHLEKLKKWVHEKEVETFTNRTISQVFRIPIATIKRHHYQLIEHGYLEARKEKGKRAYHYQISAYGKEDHRLERIEEVLQTALKTAEQLTSSVTAQLDNEPINQQVTSSLPPTAQQPMEMDKRAEKKLPLTGYYPMFYRELVAKWPEQETLTAKAIAELVGKKPRTVQKYLSHLSATGHIAQDTSQKHYTYRLNEPSNPPTEQTTNH